MDALFKLCSILLNLLIFNKIGITSTSKKSFYQIQKSKNHIEKYVFLCCSIVYVLWRPFMVFMIVLGLCAIHSQLRCTFGNVLNPAWGMLWSQTLSGLCHSTRWVLNHPAGSQMSILQVFVADTLGRWRSHETHTAHDSLRWWHLFRRAGTKPSTRWHRTPKPISAGEHWTGVQQLCCNLSTVPVIEVMKRGSGAFLDLMRVNDLNKLVI